MNVSLRRRDRVRGCWERKILFLRQTDRQPETERERGDCLLRSSFTNWAAFCEGTEPNPCKPYKMAGPMLFHCLCTVRVCVSLQVHSTASQTRMGIQSCVTSRTFIAPGVLTVEIRWHLKRRRQKQTTRREAQTTVVQRSSRRHTDWDQDKTVQRNCAGYSVDWNEIKDWKKCLTFSCPLSHKHRRPSRTSSYLKCFFSFFKVWVGGRTKRGCRWRSHEACI